MGLLDVLNGMQNGPRGQPQPSAPGSGGMSKTTMALLAFLAYKAFKGFNQPQPAQAGAPSPNRGGQDREPQEPGGLAGVLRTIFGGVSIWPRPEPRRGQHGPGYRAERAWRDSALLGRAWAESSYFAGEVRGRSRRGWDQRSHAADRYGAR